MVRNITIILTLIATLVLIWIKYSDTLNHSTVEQPVAIERPVALKPSNEPNNKPNTNPDQITATPIENAKSGIEKQEQEELFTQLTTELSNSRYSEDPVIEMTSIIMEMSSCDISRTFSRWSYLESSPKWEQLNQQAEDGCQQLKQQYPLISKEKSNDQYFKLLKPTTVLGKQLYDAFVQIENSPDFALEYINDIYYIGVQSQNAQMISMAKLFSTAGFNPNDNPFPHQELLQTTDSQYIRLIDQLALEVMACSYNNGVTCQPQNYNMLDRCKQLPEVCGLNFNQWFDTYVSLGIKADVQIMSEYYQQLNP